MPAGNAKSNPDNIKGYFPGETTDIRITPPERVSFDFVSNIKRRYTKRHHLTPNLSMRSVHKGLKSDGPNGNRISLPSFRTS